MKRLGFVIANELEEYLSYSETDRYHSHNIWCSTYCGRMFIEMIRVFPTLSECRELISNIETHSKIWILALYETKSRYCVSSIGEDCPSWLKRG